VILVAAMLNQLSSSSPSRAGLTGRTTGPGRKRPGPVTSER
jgi:hypothetical protein